MLTCLFRVIKRAELCHGISLYCIPSPIVFFVHSLMVGFSAFLLQFSWGELLDVRGFFRGRHSCFYGLTGLPFFPPRCLLVSVLIGVVFFCLFTLATSPCGFVGVVIVYV